MPSLSQTMSVLVITALGSVNAAMGPAFSTGPVSSGSWIREATSTLTLPKAPSGNSGDASLWVGMGTSNGDLIQSIADNWNSNDWSVFAYTLVSTSCKKARQFLEMTVTDNVNSKLSDARARHAFGCQGWR